MLLSGYWESMIVLFQAQCIRPVQEIQEMRVWSLGQEDSFEEEMETHSIILAWKIPWTEEHGGLQSMGLHRVRHDWAHVHTMHREGFLLLWKHMLRSIILWMGRQYVTDGILFSYKKQWSTDTCYKIDEPWKWQNKRCWTQKAACYMIPFIQKVQNRQTYRDRKSISGC